MKLLSIDPGLSGCGIVELEKINCKFTSFALRKSLVIRTKLNQFENLMERMDYITYRINQEFYYRKTIIENFEYLLIEKMQFHGNSAKSFASTAQGNLFDLTLLSGYLINSIQLQNRITHRNIYLIPAQEWKGQLSYIALKARIKNCVQQGSLVINEESGFKFREHETDALGIALYFLELINQK